MNALNPNKSYSIAIPSKNTDATPTIQALFNTSLIELHIQ